jgi:predicted dehydrogenase
MDRRSFVYLGAAAAATGVQRNLMAQSPNDQIRVATIGVNGRGMSHVESLMNLYGVDRKSDDPKKAKKRREGGPRENVKLVAICDVDNKVLGQKGDQIEKAYGVKVDLETDLRKLFERKDIDAITIATPNHWHALAAIWACDHGKDVYVEKPGCHNVHEGRRLVEAAKRNNRIVQHGVQLRSSPAVQEAVEHLRKGTIGDVYMARGLCFKRRPSVGKKPDGTPPANLNWDLWQGPAKERPFSTRYVHYDWHWHWDFGNGDIGNQGIHQTDMCLWGLGVGLPSEIQGMGGKFLWDDDKETPETLSTAFYYPEQKKMIEFEVRPWATNKEDGVGVGNIFYGSKGHLIIPGYNSYEIVFYNDGKKASPGPKRKDPAGPDVAHVHNWLQAMRARKPELQNGGVESAHTSSSLAHLGNIAFRVGRRLKFDPKTEKFIGDSEADKLLTREYRKPYEVV